MNQFRALKVLHIASGDLWAGAEVQLFTLAKTLRETGAVSITVILLSRGTLEEKLKHEGLKVIVLDESRLSGLRILQEIFRHIREIRPDVIHTHRTKENILGSIAARAGGNIPSLRTVHGAPEHPAGWSHLTRYGIFFLDWLCGRYLQRTIIAVSEDLAEILRHSYPAGKVRVIENGIALQLAGIAGDLSDQGVHGLSPLKIGLACRLVPVKCVDIFIETAKTLRDRYPGVQASFHIYGDGPLRQDMEQLSRQLKTEDIVHFEGHSEEMVQRLQELDVLLMTSDHEGLPMVLLESMALQVPIIAHAVGGIPTLLEEGRCGILVRDHSPEGYAEAIHLLAESPGERREIARKALDRVKNHYSAEQNAGAYLEQYRILAGS